MALICVAFTVTLIALHPFRIPIHFDSCSSKIDMLYSIVYLTGDPVGSPRNRLQDPAGQAAPVVHLFVG